MGHCVQTSASTGQPCRGWAMPGSDRRVSHLGIAHRKTSLTPQVSDRIALMLRSGVPIGTACAAVGVSKTTFHRWITRDEPLYVAFREQVERARAEGEAALVLRIASESATHWQAAAWILARSSPAQFGPPGNRPAASDDGLFDLSDPSDLLEEFAVVSHDDAPG